MGAWPEGYGRLILEETGSTMDEARARASSGEAGPIWIMARRQTRGRGRRGRPWADPGGNLAANLLIRPQMTAAEAARLSFAASLAVSDLFGALAPAARIQVKWPNDVLLEGGKCCGILLESEGAGGRIDWLSIGIGVNLTAHPPADPEAAFPPIALASLGVAPPPPERALEILADRFAHWFDLYRAQGFPALRDPWLARAARLGETIQARLPSQTLTGVFADLDEAGNLVLSTPQGDRKIAAAEVFFP